LRVEYGTAASSLETESLCANSFLANKATAANGMDALDGWALYGL
jgi:hypothetical protein